MRIDLSAFQSMNVDGFPHHHQCAAGTKIVRLTTAMDEHFINRTVTAILTPEDQQKIIEAFTKE